MFALHSPDEPLSENPPPFPYASLEIADVETANPPRFSSAWWSLRFRTLRHPAAAWYNEAARTRFRALLDRVTPDAIVYGMSWVLPYHGVAGTIPGIADEQNYDPLIAARIAQQQRGLRALQWKLYVQLTASAERRNLAPMRAISACSEEDAAIFRREAPHAMVAVVPNGVDTASFSASPLGDDVVMTGSFTYAPNIEGAGRLAHRIWPLVRAQVPGAQLRFAGLDSERALRELAAIPGVTIAGTVQDMRTELARARVCVAPIDVGGGTRIKILEALAAARPVVSTTVGAEGLGLQDGDTVLLRDDDEGFANAIVQTLRDRAIAESLATRGRAFVLERYDWSASALRLEALVAKAAGAGR